MSVSAGFDLCKFIMACIWDFARLSAVFKFQESTIRVLLYNYLFGRGGGGKGAVGVCFFDLRV